MVWIETRVSCCPVENRIEEHRRLEVKADVASMAFPQPPQSLSQDGAADSEIDTATMKEQGKVYRTDSYTVHWRADGRCQPLSVRLEIDGEVSFEADCLPEDGALTLSRSYMLEPPGYDPPGPGFVRAHLEVQDCAGLGASCSNEAPRA